MLRTAPWRVTEPRVPSPSVHSTEIERPRLLDVTLSKCPTWQRVRGAVLSQSVPAAVAETPLTAWPTQQTRVSHGRGGGRSKVKAHWLVQRLVTTPFRLHRCRLHIVSGVSLMGALVPFMTSPPTGPPTPCQKEPKTMNLSLEPSRPQYCSTLCHQIPL